jgi:hypothetical protein
VFRRRLPGPIGLKTKTMLGSDRQHLRPLAGMMHGIDQLVPGARIIDNLRCGRTKRPWRSYGLQHRLIEPTWSATAWENFTSGQAARRLELLVHWGICAAILPYM